MKSKKVWEFNKVDISTFFIHISSIKLQVELITLCLFANLHYTIHFFNSISGKVKRLILPQCVSIINVVSNHGFKSIFFILI
ncbi:hypothetical protein V6Z12_A07G203800 [Gossypium hirsutum]